jgi:hypothetical protein
MNAKKPIRRRDPQGRIDPQYARELLEKARETKNDHDSPEAGRAFLRGPSSNEALAEEMGEAFTSASRSKRTAAPSSRRRATKSLRSAPTSRTSRPPRASRCLARRRPFHKGGGGSIFARVGRALPMTLQLPPQASLAPWAGAAAGL